MTAATRTRGIHRVIVFDLDDTLFLERDYAQSGFRAVGQWMEANYSVSNFAVIAARHFAEGRRDRIFDASLAELGIEQSTALIDQLVQIYRSHRPQISLAPDALEFLDQVQDGEALALLTDGFLVPQRHKVEALELEKKGVWPVVCTDVWGKQYWKPDDRGFKHIQSLFALAPSAFTYVADNLTKDFVAPRRLGWHTVQIVRPQRVRRHIDEGGGVPADCVIESLRELRAHLESF